MLEITHDRAEHTINVLTENFLSRLAQLVAELDSYGDRHDPTGPQGYAPLDSIYEGLVSRFNTEVPALDYPLRRADTEGFAVAGAMIFGPNVVDVASEQHGSFVQDALMLAQTALAAPRGVGIEYLFFAVAIVAHRLTQEWAKEQEGGEPCPS